jgi:formylglycine-generating enzyme required for sulfatase activity
MLERGALIYETEDENVRFKHHAFQEYLVARRFLAEKDYSFLVQRLTSPWWREVIFLFLGHQEPSTFSQFMRELVQSGIFEKERELVLECIRAAEGTNRPPNVFVDLLLNSTASFEARYNALLALREIGLGTNRNRIDTALKNDSSRIGEFARLFLDIEQSTSTETTSRPARWQNPKDLMQYVFVPASNFDMGARDIEALPQETPADLVYLDAYYIAVHPVTNLQYQKFIQATGHFTPSGNDWWNSWIGDKYPPGMDHHPVVFVSWYDAMRYCEWAGCMLPTEAQWEKAARGPDGRIFPWGDNTERADELMNFDSNIGRTTEVGLYPDGASPYGCLDMSGNVWEWCADWFSPGYWRQERRSPKGPRQGMRRVDRGGGWQMDARRCRSAYRGHWPPNHPDRDLGFRTTVSVDRVLGKIS